MRYTWLVGDRQVWVREQAQEFCDKLRMKLPKVVEKETVLLGMRPPVHLAVVDIAGFAKAQPLPFPELRVSPAALSELDDRRLRFHVALALTANGQMTPRPSARESGITWASALLGAVAVIATWNRLLDAWLGYSIAAAIIVAGTVVVMWPNFQSRRNLYLKAAKLAGDPETAIEILSRPTNEPVWVPRWFHAKSRSMNDKQIALIRRHFGI